jgi:Secretion system C-terminal sorting domain
MINSIHIMKHTLFILRAVPVLFFVVLFIFLNGCKVTNTRSKPGVFAYQKTEKASDFDKAIEEEINLLKDPATGKIPAGVRELELKQAKDISDKQNLAGSGLVSANTYTFQGPSNLGGRTRALAFDVADATSNTIIAGSVSGGVFRTTNGGTSWTRVSTNAQQYTITAIAQDTRAGQTNNWYYATGEGLGNSASETGAFYTADGIYKSTDNGLTWNRLTASNTGSLFAFDNCNDLITNLAVDPTNGNVYAASLGQIIRSTDGGTTWGVVLGPGCGTSSQVSDIVCTSTGRLYAALAGNVSSPNDGVWTSTTGASGSWTHIAGTGSAPNHANWNANNVYGRVVLAIAPSSQNLVYALYYRNFNSNCAGTAAVEAELYRYDQTANTWTDLTATLPNEAGCSNGNDPFAVQSGYDLVVAVKPDDPATLFIGGTNLYRSTNTGSTWTRIGGYASAGGYTKYANHHPDIHVLKFGPASNSILFSGDDGGIQKADITGTVTWTELNNDYRTYQYYHVAIKQEAGVNDFIGGAQDNGTTTSIGGGASMSPIWGGDGAAVGLSSGAAPYTQFVCFQNGAIYRRTSDLAENFFNADLSPGVGSIFVTYFYLDPDNTENMYYGGTTQLRRNTVATTSTSASWVTMSFVYSGTIRAMATTRGAYTATNRLYIGTDNGTLYRLTDPRNAATGTVPTNITPTGMTGGGTIIGISVNPTDHNEILVVYSNYGVTNIWYTADASVASPTWVNVEGNLTLPSVRSCLITKSCSNTEYYVGTSIGLYKTNSMSGTVTWTQEAVSEIGNSVVTGLALRTSDNTFVIGTHGSGMWRSGTYPGYTWLGGLSTSWTDASNWSSCGAPPAAANITVASTVNQPTLPAGTTTLGTITLNAGTSINLGGNTLSVTGISGTGTITGSSTSNLVIAGAVGTLNFTQTSAATRSLNNLTLNSGSSATLGNALDVYGTIALTTATLNLNANNLTLKSNSTGTARIADLTGSTLSGAGNVTVERYIKLRAPGTGDGAANNGRAYRLLAPTVNTATSLRTNWMEGGMNTSIGTNVNPVPGFGTQVSGSGGNANGFDVTQSNQASLYLTTNAVTPTYTAIANTNGTLNALSGYFLYLRGDRSMSMQVPLGTNMPTSHTTLRTTGSLLTGTQTAFTNAFTGGGALNLITNPYPSPIDWALVQPACTNIANAYTLWDPNVGTRGGFVTVTTAGVVSGGGTATRFIQPGQAFFVQSTGGVPTVSIQEGHKSAGNNNTVFIVPPPPVESFQTALYFTEDSGFRRQADGVNVQYDNVYSKGLDENDAAEINNWDENIAINRAGKHLAIESRPVITQRDTIPLFMNNMKQRQYEFEFVPALFTNTGLMAELVDQYTGNRSLLSVADTVRVAFNITSDPASGAADRFMVVFGPKLPPGMDITISAEAKNNGVEVGWVAGNELGLDRYILERSFDGNIFSDIYTRPVVGNSPAAVSHSWLDTTPKTGINFYRIKVISKTGLAKYSDIATVNFSRGQPSVSIYPNPINGNSFGLQFTGMEKGYYSLVIINSLGQRVYTKQVQHNGGRSNMTITTGLLPKGNYQLVISGKNTRFTEKIIKQ